MVFAGAKKSEPFFGDFKVTGTVIRRAVAFWRCAHNLCVLVETSLQETDPNRLNLELLENHSADESNLRRSS